MSQDNQLTSKAIEMQRTALENGQEAIEQAIELPVEQTLEFQKRTAQLCLNGLEMGSWAQNQGVELTRDAFGTYIDTVENAAQDTTEFAENRIQQATPRQRPMQSGPGPIGQSDTTQRPPSARPQQSGDGVGGSNRFENSSVPIQQHAQSQRIPGSTHQRSPPAQQSSQRMSQQPVSQQPVSQQPVSQQPVSQQPVSQQPMPQQQSPPHQSMSQQMPRQQAPPQSIQQRTAAQAPRQSSSRQEAPTRNSSERSRSEIEPEAAESRTDRS